MLCQGHVCVLRHAQDEGHGDDVVAKTIYEVTSPSGAKMRWLIPECLQVLHHDKEGQPVDQLVQALPGSGAAAAVVRVLPGWW